MSRLKIIGVQRPILPGNYDVIMDDAKVDDNGDVEINFKDVYTKHIKKQLEVTNILGDLYPKMTEEEKLKKSVEKPYHYTVRPDYETKDVIAIMMTGKDMLRPIQSGYYFSALKYLDRFPFKETAIKDLYKSIEFIKFLIEDIEKNGFREDDDYDD